MTREEALTALSSRADALKARGAQAAYVFGSVARGEATSDSDLDVFIDVDPDRKISLVDLVGIELFLRDQLGIDIDVTTRDSLHPKLRDRIERMAIRAY
jgi:uncharacterized protein